MGCSSSDIKMKNRLISNSVKKNIEINNKLEDANKNIIIEIRDINEDSFNENNEDKEYEQKQNKKTNEKNNIIKIVISVSKKDKNSEIYFLDNSDNEYEKNEFESIHRQDNLKEMNTKNTILYINDEKHDYQKSYKFGKEGEFIIKLKLNFLI